MEENEVVDVLTLSEENKYYAKYLLKKDEFIKKNKKKFFDKKHIYDDYVYSEEDYDMDSYLYLCYITRKYFGDCAIFSAIKILFGVVALILAVYVDHMGKASSIIGLIMAGLMLYGMIQIPLCILICIANLIARASYTNYVSTYTGKVANTIKHFYDPNTDKFQTVHFRFAVRDYKTFREQRRLRRGW